MFCVSAKTFEKVLMVVTHRGGQSGCSGLLVLTWRRLTFARVGHWRDWSMIIWLRLVVLFETNSFASFWILAFCALAFNPYCMLSSMDIVEEIN